MERREFIQSAAIAAVGTAGMTSNAASDVKFRKSLVCGAIGVQANQQQAIGYAAKYGFDCVAPSIGDLEKMPKSQRAEMVAGMKEKGVGWGSSGFPVQFRTTEDTFQEGIKKFPAQAEILAEVGVTRVITYILPSSNDLTYMESFKLHRDRLGAAAKIMKANGLRFGLEFVGPQTSLVAKKFPFLHTQRETEDLIDAIGLDNVGLLLDSWHWYTSGGTEDELARLSNSDVVDVQVNDAPLGLKREEQRDNSRNLPVATGVIDLKTFMKQMVRMGYDGPISCEPFNKKLNAMDNDAALKATMDSLNRLFALVGA